MKTLALALLTLLATNGIRADEVWVVASAGKSVEVVDVASESVVATIPLVPGAEAPPARGIAFSTVDGLAGSFAFVGQGSVLHVLDAGDRSWVKGLDLGATFGVPLTIVDLESSPNRAFSTQGGAAVRAYLVVVADAVRGTGSPPEPYWIVLDQAALVHASPPAPLVAASGFLHDPAVPAADRGQAAGVSVLGSPRGDAFLRAWVTTRVPGTSETMRATLLRKGSDLDAPWLLERNEERVLPAGRRAPRSFAVAVPHDGEAQIFPAGATGTLADLGHDGSCELPANVGPVAVRGPGAGGYQIVAVDLDAEDLLRVNESTCAFQRFPVGRGPTDLTVDALFGHGATWVANRDSDDVTVVRLDGSSARVPLGAPPAGDCVVCPVSIEARLGAGRACTTSLRLTKELLGVSLDWATVGCTGASYSVFCQCDRRLDLDCPCACDPLETPGCLGSRPISGESNVESGLVGMLGPLARQLPGYQGPLAFPPEPVIQLGYTGAIGGGGGGVWIGTRPP